MGVSVTSQGSGGSGSPPVTSFQDTFNRADQPFFVGNFWLPLISQGTLATGTNLAANVGVAAASLVLTTPLAVQNCAFVPSQVTWLAIQNRPQFSEVKISAYNLAGAAAVTCGPGFWIQTQGTLATIGYYIRLENGGAGILNARLAYGFSPITTVVAPVAVLVGDTIRIDGRDNGAAGNDVRILQNGVVVSSATDVTANRPRSSNGIFGIVCESGTAGGSCSFQNYSGGIW